MSGPKVVRIVTREELIAQGEGMLARVAAALAAWERACDRVDDLTEAEKAAGQKRLAKLRQMLREDRFIELQKEAQRELAFLKDDQRERLAKAAAAAAAARRADLRRGEAARTLLAALDKAGAALSDDLRAALLGAVAGRDDPAALARGFALLSVTVDDGAADRRALAARYKDGEEDRSLAGWLQAQPQEIDPRGERLQAAIDTLASLGDPGRTQGYQDRLVALLSEAPGARRNLLADSLEIELSQALKAARETADLLEDLRLDLAELAQLHASQEDAIFHQRLEAALTEPSALTVLATDVANALVAAKAGLAARARRDAVLQSLAGLGYEVTEGLSTAWVSDGKVVLRKADRPDYGVEISGGAAAARFQMRAVAFAGPDGGPDISRDRDAETLWCGDVTALKADLAQAGGDLVIEKALAIGATPLKRIEAAGLAAGAEVVRAPGLKTIKPR